MIGTGVLGLLQRPGPPGILLIVAFVLMYLVRPWLDQKAQRPFKRRAAPSPASQARPPPGTGRGKKDRSEPPPPDDTATP